MPPVVNSVSPSQGTPLGGTTVTITGTGFSSVTAVRFGSRLASSYTVNSPTQITAVTPAGTGTVRVTVSTTDGTSTQDVMFAYVTAPVPTLSGVVPSEGPTSGGTTVTLTGTGLSGVTAVRFGSTPATSFTVNSSTQITAVSPAGNAGAVAVTVTSPGGTSNPVTFTYVTAAVPTLSGVVPSEGPMSGGTTVTLTGTDLSGVTDVSFGSTPATSFTVDSSTQITAVAPAGSAGAVAVTVTSPSGTSFVSPSVFFFYAAPPTLTGITPVLGPSSGGITVMLTGADLLNATAVQFDGTPATSFTIVSSTQITAATPAGSGTSQVTVVTPGGTSNPVAFTHVAAPTLSSLVPANGPTSAGTVVTLTGTGFSTVTAVQFGTALASFTVVSDTQITATVPAGPAGGVPVTVTTPGGTSNSVPYTRVGPPGI